jgi:hypothetical protein
MMLDDDPLPSLLISVKLKQAERVFRPARTNGARAHSAAPDPGHSCAQADPIGSCCAQAAAK